ncbi:hypothetical protein D3C73_714290 [compost metagenome]
MALIVEAEAVDNGAILDQAEKPRLVIAHLRFRRQRADFDMAEAELQKRIRHFGILVVTRGETDRVFEPDAGNCLCQT